MGKNLKDKECEKGIYQRKDGLFSARYYAKAVWNAVASFRVYWQQDGRNKMSCYTSIKATMDRYVHVADESLVNAIRQFQQDTPPVSKKGRKKGVQEI